MRTDYVVFVVDCRFVSSLSIRQTNCNDFEVQFNFPSSGWMMRTQMNNFLIQMAFLPIRFELEIETKQVLRMKTFLLKIEMHASAPSSSWCWTSLWQRITFSFSAECGKMRSMSFVYVIIFEWRFGGLCKYLCERVSESLTFNNIFIWSAILLEFHFMVICLLFMNTQLLPHTKLDNNTPTQRIECPIGIGWHFLNRIFFNRIFFCNRAHSQFHSISMAIQWNSYVTFATLSHWYTLIVHDILPKGFQPH